MAIINWKAISGVLGKLLLFETFFFVLCYAVGLCYGEYDPITFGIPALSALGASGLLYYVGKGGDEHLSRRDTYLVLLLVWVVYSAFGMLPYLIAQGGVDNVADAFFETMSGFTTTGATVLTHIDKMSHSLLFWRSFTQWIGGLGIVFFMLAILPSVGSGDVRLFSSESTGFKIGKLHARFSTTTKWLWGIYSGLTLACITSLCVAGMPVFDAICHAFTTLATGGFCTHQDGVLIYHSPAIEYILSVFMFLGAVNFGLLFLLFIKRDWQSVWRDAEWRTYSGVVATATAAIALNLILVRHYPFEQAFRESFFHVTSLQTTTGFATTDVALWPAFSVMIFFLLMALGGSAGSTSGGYKCIRLYVAYKYMRNELMHLLHPKAYLRVNVGGKGNSEVGESLVAFSFLFVCLILIGTAALTLLGTPAVDALSIIISSISNVGPALGKTFGATDTWVALHPIAKWVCSFLMMAGRLELFGVILPLYSHFWKND